jgi:predicted GTPase
LKYLRGDFKIVVIGSTNVGKSTFLNYLMGAGTLLNTSEMRETACIWKIKFSSDNGDRYSKIDKEPKQRKFTLREKNLNFIATI